MRVHSSWQYSSEVPIPTRRTDKLEDSNLNDPQLKNITSNMNTKRTGHSDDMDTVVTVPSSSHEVQVHKIVQERAKVRASTPQT
jgi:hypothetical protein